MRFLVLLLILLSASAEARPRNDLMPRVEQITQDEMVKRWCRDIPVDKCATPVALYSHGTIYIGPNFKVGSVKDLGILLHEFTHHLQFIGALQLCHGAMERQAYAVQETWADQNGVKLVPGEDLPGPMLRMAIESCEGD